MDDNCPYSGSYLIEYCINVVPSNNTYSVDAGLDQNIPCGSTTTIQATVSGPSVNYTYVWNTGQTTPSIQVGPGTYIVTVTDGTSFLSDTVQVFAQNGLPPSVTISSNGQGGCFSGPITFSATAVQAGNNPTYQWYHNYQPVGNTPTITINNAATGDQVYCVVTSSDFCSSPQQAYSDTLSVVNGTGSATQPTVTLFGNTLAASPATAYQWLLNGVAIPGATSQFFQPSVNGFYQVTIVDAAGCTATSNFLLYTAAGISETDPNLAKVEVYPNPANDRLLMDLPAHTELSIDLFTMDGRWVMTLFQGRTENTGQTIQQNIHDLPAGLYTVYLRSAEGMAAKRVAVIRP